MSAPTDSSTRPIYRGMGNSGTRLAEEPLAYLDAYKSRLTPQAAGWIHRFDKAHAVMLVRTGIVETNTGTAILAGLRQMEAEGIFEARSRAGGGIHSAEQYLTKRFGHEVGGYLHIGRSSGDLGAVATRLILREQTLALIDGLFGSRDALLELAGAHLDTVMPGTTHGQHAQPTTLAHWAAMFNEVFERDTARLRGVIGRLNRSPAGAAIMTGSDFPMDREFVSDMLGFDDVLPNTLDAIQSHDVEIEFASVLLALAQSLGRLADDLMLWSTFEYAMVELPDYFCGTSSIMPQKKNPDGLEDFKSLAAQSLGVLSTLVMTERGPTGLTIMERRNSDALLRGLGEAITLRLAVMPALFRDISFNRDRMRHLAGANWACATDLSAALVRHAGVDWRTAHAITGNFVRYCLQHRIEPCTATSRDLDLATAALSLKAPALPAQKFSEAIDPVEFVRRRTLQGGPAPEAVETQIRAAQTKLRSEQLDVAAFRRRIELADARLEAAVDAMVADGRP